MSCDTDSLGTFSGEVQRLDDALSTCRRKALMGLEQSGLRLGLASEARFGPVRRCQCWRLVRNYSCLSIWIGACRCWSSASIGAPMTRRSCSLRMKIHRHG